MVQDTIVDYCKIGERIRKIRIQKGMTQQQLSEKADISTNYLSHIENGIAKFSLANLLKIIKALDTTPNRILSEYNINKKDMALEDITSLIAEFDSKMLEFLLKYIDILKGVHVETLDESKRIGYPKVKLRKP